MDRYTKYVLTLIAGALVMLALEHATPEAKAQLPAMSCGDELHPCYIVVARPVPIER